MNRYQRITIAAGVILAYAALLVGAFAFFDPPSTPQGRDPIATADTGRGPWAHPDAGTLGVWSEAAGVPVVFTYAIAWRETRNNPSPATRGKLGEVGRFQILSRTAAARCRGIDVREYYGNLACFLRMAREDAASARCAGDWRCAARIHNGAQAYADSVMLDIQKLVRRRIGT